MMTETMSSQRQKSHFHCLSSEIGCEGCDDLQPGFDDNVGHVLALDLAESILEKPLLGCWTGDIACCPS